MIPTVNLDQEEAISPELAGRLTISMLSHVLFLKNQVPFPVMQLGRLPIGGKAHERIRKRRNALLESFDALAYELPWTYQALSTSLSQHTPDEEPLGHPRKARVHVVFIVGPSVSMPKARIVMEICGLETQDNSPSEEDSDDLPPDSDCDSNDDEENEDEEESNEVSDGEEQHKVSVQKDENNNPKATFPSLDRRHKVAERLLSRTLASADVLLDDLSPTNVHVLIRAPRRFSRDAWIPKQNYGKFLDGFVRSYFESDDTELQQKRKIATEGVRVVWNSASEERCATEPLWGDDCGGKEEDEMIWFQWEGKLLGFGDFV